MGLIGMQLGCGRRRDVEAVVVTPTPPQDTLDPAGRIDGGAFQDADHPVSLELPPPWQGEVGRRAEPLRLLASHPLAQVELFVFPDGGLRMPARADCAWTFVDQGPDGVVVGSCTSGRPQDLLRLAWRWPLADGAVQLDALLGPAELAAGERAARELISGLRAGAGAPAGPAAAR